MVSKVPPKSIETLRAIAIVILVSFHVIGGRNSGDGLQIGDGHPLRIYADLLIDLRMPLFAFISGMVYAIRPVARDNAVTFLEGKARRLGLPMIVSATLFALFSWQVGGEPPPDPVWHIYLKSYTLYWFVQVILVIFVLMVVIEKLNLTPYLWVIYALAAAALINRWVIPTEWLSLNRLTTLLPHFLLGVLVIRHWTRIERTPLIVCAVAVAIMLAGLALNIAHYAQNGHFSMNRLDLQSYLFGTGAVLSGILLLPRLGWLQWLGAYSFTIYLYHIFAASAVRRVLTSGGVSNEYVHLVAGTFLGVLLPVCLHFVCARVPLTRRLVLGLRPGAAVRHRAV